MHFDDEENPRVARAICGTVGLLILTVHLGAVGSSGADDDITDRAAGEFSHCIEPLLGEVPQPYREAIELTELGGLTRKDALPDCRNVEFDHRGGLLDYDRRAGSNCDNCDCE